MAGSRASAPCLDCFLHDCEGLRLWFICGRPASGLVPRSDGAIATLPEVTAVRGGPVGIGKDLLKLKQAHLAVAWLRKKKRVPEHPLSSLLEALVRFPGLYD